MLSVGSGVGNEFPLGAACRLFDTVVGPPDAPCAKPPSERARSAGKHGELNLDATQPSPRDEPPVAMSNALDKTVPSLNPWLAAVEPSPRYVRRLTARLDEDREVILPVERIDLIRAHGNYVRLHTADGEYTRRATLTALAERLDPEHFLRLNRSEIVRLDAVRELQPWFHGDYRVILKNGRTLTWSRRYRAQTKDDF